MAPFKIEIETKPRKFLDDIDLMSQKEQELYSAAFEILSEKPTVPQNPYGTIKHLKGGFRCHHEYRNLPNEQRIYYKTFLREEVNKRYASEGKKFEWDDESQVGLVQIFYAGPHPKKSLTRKTR